MVTLLILCGGMLAVLYGFGFLYRWSKGIAGTSDFQVPPGVTPPSPPPAESGSLAARFGERIQLGEEEFEIRRPGVLGTPLVRLLFKERPALSAEQFASALRAIRPDAEVMAPQNDVFPVLFSATKSRFADQVHKALIQVSATPTALGSEQRKELEPARGCDPYALAKSETLALRASACAWELHVYTVAGPFSARVSLLLMSVVGRAVAQSTRPELMFWGPSRRLIDPDDFLQCGLREVPFLATTLRQARVEGTNDVLTDTLGFADFCLPDVQLHSQGLQGPDAAKAVWDVAMGLWEKGLAIKDGDTVGFPEGPLKVARVRYENPARPGGDSRLVIDLDPGMPFAAGARPGPEFSGALH